MKTNAWVRAAACFWACIPSACFEVRLRDALRDASTDTRGVDANHGDEPLVHPACVAGPEGSGPTRFEFSPTHDFNRLNDFAAQPCERVESPVPCENDGFCLHGRCLAIHPKLRVCVDDTRCEVPLVYQNGVCTTCVRNADKAAICCAEAEGVDCRTFPFHQVSPPGGICTVNHNCEAGLVCVVGRAAPVTGTCACPGAVLPVLSSFAGCGSPDRPLALEPELPRFSPERPARVMLVGDSVAGEIQRALALVFAEHGAAALIQGVELRSALCDYVEPANEPHSSLKALVQEHVPDVIVLQFWGFSQNPCMEDLDPDQDAYFEKIYRDARLIVDQIEQAARDADQRRPRLVWVLQGPDQARPARVERLNRLYRFVANLRGDRTSDAGATVSEAVHPFTEEPDPRHAWERFLPCWNRERRLDLCTVPNYGGGVAQIHPDHDPVHFCLDPNPVACIRTSPGVHRYTLRIANDVLRLIGEPTVEEEE